MIRSWNRWVCSTQPRLTRRAVAEGDQVGLGQPVGLAPDAAADRARRARAATRCSAGVPAAARANHGAATISTKVSASSLRQTKELHSGCSPAADPADQQPLGRRRHARRASAGGEQHHARRAAPRPRAPTRSRHACEGEQHADAERRPCSITGHDPAQLDQRRGRPAAAAAARRCGSSSPAAAGAAQPHRRAAEPGRARPWPSAGVADSTATRPSLGTAAPGRGHPGVAEEGPLADLGRARSAASRRPARRTPTIVSSARNAPSPTVVILGSSSTVDASTSRPTFAPERPQPHRREQARVEREQQRAGVVQQPLGGPHLPADPAAHRVVPLAQADAEQPHARPASAAPGRRTPSARRAARQRSAPRGGLGQRRACRGRPAQITSRPRRGGDQREAGQQRPRSAPYTASQPGRRGARRSGQRCARRRRRRRRATRPSARRAAPCRSTAEPGAHLGALPDPGARARGCCGCRRVAPAPTRTRPTCSTSPSIQ